MAKTRVALLFGGASSEHEVSCMSAAAIVNHLSEEKYQVFKLGITKKGRWLMFPGGADQMLDGSWEQCPDNVPAFLSPDRTTRGIVTNHGSTFDTVKVDVVFPALHGRNGEDGTIQGLLELAGLPYVGSGVLASATCMNKISANQVFEAHSIPHTPWMAACRGDLDNFDSFLFRISGKMRFPLFVKPAVGGSSVGVTKAHDEKELRSAMLLASAHDKNILIEQNVEGQEVECAVLGNDLPIATLPGEIVPCNEIYDYEAKYQSGDASKLYLPARISAEKQREVRDLALKAYAALGCAGLSRVDFFVEKDTERVLINEINTLPGFTNISMYPKLMEMYGIGFGDLCDRLILYALERAEG